MLLPSLKQVAKSGGLAPLTSKVVSGQLHALGKEVTVGTGEEAGRVTEPVWPLKRTGNPVTQVIY